MKIEESILAAGDLVCVNLSATEPLVETVKITVFKVQIVVDGATYPVNILVTPIFILNVVVVENPPVKFLPLIQKDRVYVLALSVIF